MRFFASASALLAMITAAVAQTADFNPIFTPTELEEVPAGEPFVITWSAPAKYADGTVSISLIGGADQGTQVPIADIASGVDNSDETFTWNVDATLGDAAVYGLVFRFESNPEIFQYSQPFHIKASSDAGSDEDSDKPTVIVTTSTGVKTVTLTSCSTTSTSTTAVETTTSAPEETPTPIETPSETPSETPIETPSTTLVTSTKVETPIVVPPPTTVLPPPVPTNEVPPPVSTPTEVPESGAARVGSAFVAVAAGVAAALLL